MVGNQNNLSGPPYHLLPARRIVNSLLLSISLFSSLPGQAGLYTFSQFDIPAQPLADALVELSRQSGVQLVYKSELVEGLTAPSVVGYLSLEKAVMALLADTQLEFKLVDQTLAIVAREQNKALTPTSAGATEQTHIEEVLVTGTRILRKKSDILYPSYAFDQTLMKTGGFSSLGSAFFNVAMVGPTRYSLDSSDNFRNVGAYYPNLYRLGSQRTLTLVNGRRLVSSNEPAVFTAEPGMQVDLNAIPNSIIDRVEIISVGGAPVYGSDAIGGTVNIIFKENFEGLELEAQRGISEAGDGEEQRFSLLAGNNLGGGRGHILVSYEYHKQDGVLATERSFSRSNYGYAPNPLDTGPDDGIDDFIYTADLTTPWISVAGMPSPRSDFPPFFAVGFNQFVDDQQRPLTFGDDGRLRPAIIGEPTGSLTQTIGGDGARFDYSWSIQLPIERNMFNLLFNYDIASNFSTMVEFLYYRGESYSPVGLSSLNAGFFDSPSDALAISVNNPFLDPDDRNTLLANGLDPVSGVFYLHKELHDLNPGRIESENDIYRFVMGFEGDLRLFGETWNWELSANRGHAKSTTQNTDIIEANFREAIQATRDMNGEIICVSGNPTCVPLNPMGIIRDQNAIAYSTVKTLEVGESDQSVLAFTLVGSAGSLAGGPVSLSLGAEVREEKSQFEPDEFIQSGRGRVPVQGPIHGDYSTEEWYLEMVAPLVGKPQRDAFSLNLEGSIRGVNHSVAGFDTAHTVGARARFPLGQSNTLSLRANQTRSIRAPSITESLLPPSPVLTNALDPCDSRLLGDGDDPLARREACIADAQERGASYDPDSFISDIVTSSEILIAGNRKLENENAHASTWGIVYTAGNPEKFSLMLDFLDIEIRELIQFFNLGQALRACYDRGSRDTCSTFERDPDTFQITAFPGAYQNTGTTTMEAIQLASRYQTGRWMVDISGLNTLEYKESNANATVDLNGTIPIPEWKWHLDVKFNWRKVRLGWSAFHISSTEPQTEDVEEEIKIADYWLHDLSIAYSPSDRATLELSIRNAFDADVPEGLPSFGFSGSYYDLVGRYFTLSLGLKL